ncbi:hypothetical protein GCM10011591_41690 [Nocardia camponoti]|uniref:Uncharacterized protein n=1 Tax=Nocardia camponoti TaxID=1616106 RepID=A0A917QRK1_9NOCA|nr:hypothetical protein GCM10011591_41690 [Nocardia camponoti]
MGHYSSMDDEWITFWPDGSGEREHARPFSSELVFFHWSVVRLGLVSLEAYSAFREEEGQIADVYDLPEVTEARYRIQSESRPLLDAPIPVLHVDGWGSREGYGFITAELTERDRWQGPTPELPDS